jgi:hypothetical protein
MREIIDEKACKICYTCILETWFIGKSRKMVGFLESSCHVLEWMANLDGETHI